MSPLRHLPGEKGALDLPSDKRLLHPAWYGLPIALFLFLAYGNPLLLVDVGPIQDLSAWLLQRGPVQRDAQTVQSMAKALSLLLMPLQLVGVFWVLWPMRGWNVKVHLDRNRQPSPVVELACILFFAGGLYAHYFLPGGCAFCPKSTGGTAVMEAVILFVLPYALFGAVVTFHTRLVLFSSR